MVRQEGQERRAEGDTAGARHAWADLARVVAMVAVVVLHCAAPLLVQYEQRGPAHWWVGNLYDSAARWCVPLFVMVSGGLLLGRTRPWRRYFGRRARRVLLPFVAWTLIYFAWAVGFFDRAIEPEALLRVAVEEPIYYHLWFFYMLLGLYVLAPIVDTWLRAAERRDVAYLLAIWFAWASVLPMVERLFAVDVYLSPAAADSPARFLGYFVLGHVLRDVRLAGRGRWLAGLALLAGFAATAGGTWYLTVVRGGGAFDGLFYEYYSVNVLVMSVALFLLLQSVRPGRFAPHLRAASALVFGVYLVHAMFIGLFKSGRLGFELSATTLHPAIGVPLFAAAVYAASCLAVMLLRRIPLVARIVP